VESRAEELVVDGRGEEGVEDRGLEVVPLSPVAFCAGATVDLGNFILLCVMFNLVVWRGVVATVVVGGSGGGVPEFGPAAFSSSGLQFFGVFLHVSWFVLLIRQILSGKLQSAPLHCSKPLGNNSGVITQSQFRFSSFTSTSKTAFQSISQRTKYG